MLISLRQFGFVARSNSNLSINVDGCVGIDIVIIFTYILVNIFMICITFPKGRHNKLRLQKALEII